MKDIKYIIADNVKLYRKKQNLTQFELAEKAELSVDSIKRIEHGSRTMSLENFMRIADALAVPLSYLLYENLNEIPITERILNILNSKSDSYIFQCIGINLVSGSTSFFIFTGYYNRKKVIKVREFSHRFNKMCILLSHFGHKSGLY